MRAVHKKVWYGILAINVAIILLFWWRGSGSLFAQGLAGALIAVGRLAGFTTAGFVLLQFVMMGRTPWLERAFGLDRLARIHRRHGKLVFYSLIAHPVLLTLGYSFLVPHINPITQFVNFIVDYKHVVWAVVGLLLFVVVIATSITISRSRFRYESWYFVHLLVYAAVFASFWHQIHVGSDLLANHFFYWYWIALYVVVFGLHVTFRFGRPLYLFYRHQFTVQRIVRENYNTVSLHIEGKALNRFSVQPGQFMIFRFLTKGLWWQAHPFSLSFLPNGKELRITVKELGDFTQQVKNILPGTKVLIDGPYGIFTDLVSVSPKALLIAGGIGITPIRSLMEQMVRKGKEAMLLYANRTRHDIVFQEELNALASQLPAGKVINVLSDDIEYGGEKGFLDAEKIQRLVPDVATRDVYVCGPPPMMDVLIPLLRKLGVPPANILYERFAL